MFEFSQTEGKGSVFLSSGETTSGGVARRWRGAPGWIFLVGLLPGMVWAQSLRLGPWDLNMTFYGEIAYDSNVDNVYPEEEKPDVYQEDIYLRPGITISSKSVPMRPNTTITLGANVNYLDYLRRDDLDTEQYTARISFQTTHPRLTLGGLLSTEYSVEGKLDKYMPGGVSRDPVRTDVIMANLNWNYRIFRIISSYNKTIERHDYPMYQMADNDETKLLASAFMDIFRWGSLFYTWEDTTTLYLESDEEIQETSSTFGLTGAIPVEILRRPSISYSLGLSYKEERINDGEPEKTWEPTHTITVSDEFQLTRAITLSGLATWQNTVKDDEVTFIYSVRLLQLLGPYAEHSVTFTQEPRPTFGSTTDTETTTYAYAFTFRDLLMKNLRFNLNATYEENTPLGEVNPQTEKISRLSLNWAHVRQLTRKLNRILSYTYTLETSNFHTEGANEKHLLVYGVTCDF